jgi:hypothetical protein
LLTVDCGVGVGKEGDFGNLSWWGESHESAL